MSSVNDVRWYPAHTAEARGPQRPRASPGRRPRQRADRSAPRWTVRDLRRSGPGASSPDPQALRHRQARTPRPTRMGQDHGQATTQNPRGLRHLPRHDPPREANRVNHGIAAGEPGDQKWSRRVREGGVGEGPAQAPRRRRTSTRRAPSPTTKLERRQEGHSAAVIAIAWKAQQRLHHLRRRLDLKHGKRKTLVAAAVARHLAGFCWAIATTDMRPARPASGSPAR